MFGYDAMELLFIIWAFFVQVWLILHFITRRYAMERILQYGWVTYLLGIPAAIISVVLLLNGQSWVLWAAGFIHLVWAFYGYLVEYIYKIEWRHPIRRSVFVPYILMYLATIMFYWWPLANISRPLWGAYTVLFIISTVANLASHQPADTPEHRVHA